MNDFNPSSEFLRLKFSFENNKCVFCKGESLILSYPDVLETINGMVKYQNHSNACYGYRSQ